MDYAFGELGLRPREFWRLTWEEYDRLKAGYQLRQIREWERTRQHAEWMAAFLGVNLKKELRGKRLMDLPTDTKKQRSAAEVQSAKAFRDEIEARALAKAQKK